MSAQRAVALLAAIPLAAAATLGAGLLVAGVHRRLGVSAAEAAAPLPGDELLPGAAVQNDRACTIQAAPSEVWPWIAQLGQEKAGFYSFETLENLAGCQITGATRIHEEWQGVATGDAFRLHPEVALRVAQVEPERSLVVTSQGGQAPGDVDFDMTWVFCLSPVSRADGETVTRLHLRERYDVHGGPGRVMIELTGLISAIMTWRMMGQLQRLVAGTVNP